MKSGMSSGTAKSITKITEDRVVIDHHPTRFVKIYIDPRQDGKAMNAEAIWIKNRILENEELRKSSEDKDTYSGMIKLVKFVHIKTDKDLKAPEGFENHDPKRKGGLDNK